MIPRNIPIPHTQSVSAALRREKMQHAARQFIIFCLIGVINTLVDVGIYYLLTRAVWSPEFITIPKVMSYLAATMCSFTLNRFITFKKKDRVRFAELWRFYTTVGMGIFINAGALALSVYVFGLHDLIGVAIAALLTAVWGFAFSKWYVFRT